MYKIVKYIELDASRIHFDSLPSNFSNTHTLALFPHTLTNVKRHKNIICTREFRTD